MTLVPLSKALFALRKVRKVVHSVLPARLLVDETHAYKYSLHSIMKNYKNKKIEKDAHTMYPLLS